MMETKEQKNESRTKEKKPLTEQQRQQRQKMLVYPLMVLLFAGCMWLIFAPSSEDKEKERQGQGFNTDMPMPEDSKIIGDKAKAYEQQDLENKRKERRGMVGDLSAFWNDSDGDTPTDDADTSDDYRLTRTETTDGETADERQAGIRTSAAAYQRLNTSLGTFYEPPKEDTEKEELRERTEASRGKNCWTKSSTLTSLRSAEPPVPTLRLTPAYSTRSAICLPPPRTRRPEATKREDSVSISKGDGVKRAAETESSRSRCISFRTCMCPVRFATESGITGKPLR